MNTLTDHPRRDARSLPRRRVYLGEGLTLRDRVSRRLARRPRRSTSPTKASASRCVLATDVDDAGGRARSSPSATRGAGAPAIASRRWCDTSAACRPAGGRSRGSGSRWCPTTTRVADVDRREGVRYPCPEALPAFAAARVPVVLRRDAALPHRRGRRRRDDAAHDARRIRRCCRGRSSTSSCTSRRSPVESGRGRLTSVRRDEADGGFEVGVAWVDPPRELLNALSRYLLAGDDDADARDPARRRPHRPRRRARGDLRLRHLGRRLRGDPRPAPACPSGRGSPRQRVDRRPALAVRRALAPPHLPLRRADRRLRARHLRRRRSRPQPVRLARRPRGPAVALGRRLRRGRRGRDASGLPARRPVRPADAAPLPRGGAVRAPLRPRGVPRRAARRCTATWASRCSRNGLVEPKPGWRFRSHLLYADAERLLRDPPASGTVAAMASAIDFAGLPVAA